MADEERENTFENSEDSTIESQSNIIENKSSATLKDATSKLKIEALRRFKLEEGETEQEQVLVCC